MKNRTAKFITTIERILESKYLTERQRQTLAEFDRFNQLEGGVVENTRRSYLTILYKLGKAVRKPFEDMTKEELMNYIHQLSKLRKEGIVNLVKSRIKRFFRYLEYVKVNRNRPDEEKEDIKDVKAPYCVRWIKTGRPIDNDMVFEDLPTEEEILRIATCVDRQRDRALILTLWETAASPSEILGLRVKDIRFD